MHSDPSLYLIISSSYEEFIAGIDDDYRYQTANVVAYSDADKARRRLCQSEVCLSSNLDNDNVRSPLGLAMDYETAGLTMVSDILATE